MLRRTCQEYGISLSRVYRSDGIETNMRLVRDGMGVVLGPESFASYYGVSAVPLHLETFVSLKFICLQNGMKKKDVQLFRSGLRCLPQARNGMSLHLAMLDKTAPAPVRSLFYYSFG